MRIGYLYDLNVYPPKGGNHRHVLELVQGFLGNGHSVLVVDDPTVPGATNYSSSLSQIKEFLDEIDILYVRIDARFTRTWKVLSDCMDAVGDRPIIWEINSPANENLAYSWLGGKLALACNEESKIRRFRRWLHALRQKPGIFWEERYRKSLAGKVTAAICVSEAVGRYARSVLNMKDVVVIPNGGPLVPESEILERRKRRERNEFTVLYSGSAIYPWQGLDYLYKVIKLAEQASLGITFVLAVNQKIPSLTRARNVIIKEGLNQEEVRDAICAADLCVALIPEWPWSEYGFHGSPTKLFEYMALMVPVLTSNHGQMSSVIRDGENGLLTENIPEKILENILYVKENPSKAKEIGKGAWLSVRSEYNWEHNVSETLSVFDRALNNI